MGWPGSGAQEGAAGRIPAENAGIVVGVGVSTMPAQTLQFPSSTVTALTPLQVVGNGSVKGILWDGQIPELEWEETDCIVFHI